MNYFEFNSGEYKTAFDEAVKDLSLSLQSVQNESAETTLQMIGAIQGYIDVMQRLDADQVVNGRGVSAATDASQIGDHVLNLLDDIATVAVNRGLQETMLLLHRLSLPVALWIETHQGEIERLDIIVNAIANYANELKDPAHLAELCGVISKIQSVVADNIQKDVELSNPMRPWRILNLNWGIIATRTLNPELMAQVFEQLIHHIPADAKDFFREGMQQMDIVGYPDEVRQVMEKYSSLLGAGSSLH